MDNWRRFILITLAQSGRGERKKIEPEEIRARIQALFRCKAIVIAQEKDQDGEERDHHVGVLKENAHRKKATKRIRESFPEWQGRQCNVSFHKAWNTICTYVTKEDKEPYVWGNFSREQILEQARARQSHKKKQKEGEEKKEERTNRIFERYWCSDKVLMFRRGFCARSVPILLVLSTLIESNLPKKLQRYWFSDIGPTRLRSGAK